MKKIKLLSFNIILLAFVSCKKDSGTTATSANTTTGNYVGNINVSVNNIPIGTLNNKSVVISPGGSATDLSIATGVINSNTATLSGNVFTIPRHTVSTTTSYNTVEYGTGTFTNNTLVIDFHQDQVNPTTSAVMGAGEWVGTLIKQ
jgi:hypothetical protein